jgi:hypothetical protein
LVVAFTASLCAGSFWSDTAQKALRVKDFVQQSWQPATLDDTCHGHQYTVEIMSLDPLIIYINGFLSLGETEHLVKSR